MLKAYKMVCQNIQLPFSVAKQLPCFQASHTNAPVSGGRGQALFSGSANPANVLIA